MNFSKENIMRLKKGLFAIKGQRAEEIWQFNSIVSLYFSYILWVVG
jgi:hypothetical protein